MLGWRRESAPIGRFPDGTAPILGAGVSGLCMGIQLKRAGLNEFRIF